MVEEGQVIISAVLLLIAAWLAFMASKKWVVKA
jgi:hypothetical protein